MPEQKPPTVKVKIVRYAPEPGGFHSGALQHRIMEWPARWNLPHGATPITNESIPLTPEGVWLEGDGVAEEIAAEPAAQQDAPVAAKTVVAVADAAEPAGGTAAAAETAEEVTAP